MEVMYSVNPNNGYFNKKNFVGFYGNECDLGILIDNLDEVKLDNKKVKKYIKYNEEFFDILGLDKDILKKKVNELGYSDYKLVLLLHLLSKNPSVIVLNYFDMGFNHKDKSKISKFIKLVNASMKISFILISNDTIFMNKVCKHVIVCKKRIIKFQGTVIDAIMGGYIDKPVIMEFVDKANEKGAGLEYTLDNKELLKSIYRSCF